MVYEVYEIRQKRIVQQSMALRNDFVFLCCLILCNGAFGVSLDNDTVIVTSQSTCDGLQVLVSELMANVLGSTCEMDNDNNICNDCLQLNCTVQVGSAFGPGFTLPVPVFAKIHPCYEANRTHALELLLPGGLNGGLLRIMTVNSSINTGRFTLGGFVGDYDVNVTLEQRGDGVLYGMSVQQSSSSMAFTVFERRFIPIECREVLQSTCLVTVADTPSGLTAGEISAIAVCIGVFIIVLLTAVLAGIILATKKRKNNRNTELAVANNYAVTFVTESIMRTPGQNDLLESDKGNNEYSEISPYFSFNPKYGVTVPNVDFHHFNITRKEGGSDEWDYPREKLTYMRELGEGQFGKVLLMKAQDIAGYTGSVPVAVKTLASTDKEDRMKFLEEVELMKKFTHPNIVSLLGTCGEVEDGAPMMILELMPYGDLLSFLIKQKEDSAMVMSVCDFEVYHIAADIASALNFLADNKYVHRDIAARNCLVGDHLRVKLADFGLARPIHTNDVYQLQGQAKLPLRWMAPESISYGVFSTKSDVWSYGVLLYEIATFGERPYDDLEAEEIITYARKDHLRLPRPVNCPDLLYSIITQCQEPEPDLRPEFKFIQVMLTRERARTVRSNKNNITI